MEIVGVSYKVLFSNGAVSFIIKGLCIFPDFNLTSTFKRSLKP